MDRPKILIVEDDFLIRVTLAEALADEGFEVLEADCAEEAIAYFDRNDIRLMMTDIQLAGAMNGEQLAAQIRATNPDLPMIFMSGQPRSAGAGSTRDI